MDNSPPPAPDARARRRKPLNIERIKSTIVFLAGTATAFGSGLTGLGAQVAFAPMLEWMLGFRPEKALATAMRYAAVVAVAAVVGAYTGKVVGPAALWQGVLLFIGATLGAMLTARIASHKAVAARRSRLQMVGTALTLFVIIQTSRMSSWEEAHFAEWSHPFSLFLLSVAVGGLTQILGLAGGIVMVPALYYLGGFGAREAVTLSLMVVALAAILPAWSYSKRGLTDKTYGGVAEIGGVIGGFLGGWTLSRMPEHITLYLFAVVGMFLCARELARTAFQSPR